MDSAEDVLGAQKAGKRPCGPVGLNCSTETSNSSSFWRAQRGGAKNLALDLSADQQQGEMLRPPRRAQHDRPESSMRADS